MNARHPNCVTDPLTRLWWREYRRLVAEGKCSGLSFTEYVTQRTLAESAPPPGPAPAYMAGCGHVHDWGASCSRLAI